MALSRLASAAVLAGVIGLSLICGTVLRGQCAFADETTPPAKPPVAAPAPDEVPDFAAQRTEMVRLVQKEARLVAEITGIAEIGPRVLAAMDEVPRHAFVPEPLVPYAYLPLPLLIHPEQRLAAPFLVALMTHLAEVGPGQRILETGTGEGYHAAVLAQLAAEVYSVELIPELAREATRRLSALGYGNVRVREGDGYYGWREAAPFDAIIVKEAVDHVPGALLAQLRPGGRLVLPLGPLRGRQELTVVYKGADGSRREKHILPVRFTPFQGGERT
jgi:protein-L-isoaspartate(D-aspartate) O-methyltransferase